MANRRTFNGNEARALLRRGLTGTLASLHHETGIPYGSLVNVATDVEGQPLLLLSRLAWHTQNLLADPRASLLIAEMPASGDALTGQRVTVLGEFEPYGSAQAMRRYLAHHPEAEGYATFGDFGMWRMKARVIHAVAGFGRIETIEPDEVFPSASEIGSIEEGAVAQINAICSPCQKQHLLEATLGQPGPWKVTAIDGDGCTLISHHLRSRRISWSEPVFTQQGLQEAISSFAEGHQE
jgi:hypothetical protein